MLFRVEERADISGRLLLIWTGGQFKNPKVVRSKKCWMIGLFFCSQLQRGCQYLA